MRLIIDIDVEQDQPAADWVGTHPALQAYDPPMERDQQRALYAAFTQAFGERRASARHLFTRMVLGWDVDAHVSWVPKGYIHPARGLTQSEASRLLDVLDVIERTQIAVDAA